MDRKQPISIFLNKGVNFTSSISNITHYINSYILQNKVEYSEQKEIIINFLEKLLPIENAFLEHNSMGYFVKIHHLVLINLLQLYLEKTKFNYLFFNSLWHFPINKNNQNPGHIFENFVNWNNWFPYADERSYDYYWGEKIMKKKQFHTDSSHPSELSVEIFASELSLYIRKNY